MKLKIDVSEHQLKLMLVNTNWCPFSHATTAKQQLEIIYRYFIKQKKVLPTFHQLKQVHCNANLYTDYVKCPLRKTGKKKRGERSKDANI